MTRSRDTRSVGGERVRFRRASAKPERRLPPKTGQRGVLDGERKGGGDEERESEGSKEDQKERDGTLVEDRERGKEREKGEGGKREKKREGERVGPNVRCSLGSSTVTWRHTVVDAFQWTDAREGPTTRTKGGRGSRDSGLWKRTYRVRYEAGYTPRASRCSLAPVIVTC